MGWDGRRTALRGRREDVNKTGDAELILGALHPPCELNSLVRPRFDDFRRTRIGGGDEDGKLWMPSGLHEAAMDLRTHSGVSIGIDGSDLIY